MALIVVVLSCSSLASGISERRRLTAEAEQTAVAQQTATMQAALNATATAATLAKIATQTAVAAPTVTALAQQNATATSVALAQIATQTAAAAPIVTAQAVLDAAATEVAQQATAAARATSEMVASLEQTAAAEQRARATAVIEAYRAVMPKGFWFTDDGGLRVAVGDFRYANSAGLLDAGAGTKYIAFSIAVFNGRTFRSVSVNPLYFRLVDLDGSTYAPNLLASASYWSQPLQGVDVDVGNNTAGGIVFEIDADTGPAEIIFDEPGLIGGRVTIDVRRLPDQEQE